MTTEREVADLEARLDAYHRRHDAIWEVVNAHRRSEITTDEYPAAIVDALTRRLA